MGSCSPCSCYHGRCGATAVDDLERCDTTASSSAHGFPCPSAGRHSPRAGEPHRSSPRPSSSGSRSCSRCSARSSCSRPPPSWSEHGCCSPPPAACSLASLLRRPPLRRWWAQMSGRRAAPPSRQRWRGVVPPSRPASPSPTGCQPPCHTCFSKENQVQTYMHARIKFHAYSDI
jgi:hypothetical protein